MYVKRVVLNQIKAFETADLDLCPDGESYPGWSVVTGDNGAGKSALLGAIALALLGPDQARVVMPDVGGWVTQGFESGTISVEVKPDRDFDKTLKGGYPVKATFWAEVEITAADGVWDMKPTDVFRNKKRGASNGPWPSSTGGWFGVGYGPFRRLYGSSLEAQRLMMIHGRIPRFATLFREDATLSEGEEWIKQLNYRALEEKGPSDEKRALDNLLRLLRADFLREGVQLQGVNSEGMWLLDSAGRRMALTHMSDGYRSALAMLIDLFRHLVSVFGHDIVSEADDGTLFVDRPGVVLIDEIDAHLHPEWQREIGFWLKRHFPLLQFIVTTHSPLVAPAADGGRIYHLPQPGHGTAFRLTPEDYATVIAGKPDEILITPAFGLAHTRSPLAVDKRKRHSLLISKKLSAAQLTGEEERELEQLALFAESD